jgi:hypothetical protein
MIIPMDHRDRIEDYGIINYHMLVNGMMIIIQWYERGRAYAMNSPT